MSSMYSTRIADGVEFAYRDSGAPSSKTDYITIIAIHGHTFHSAIFLPMVEVASSLGYRFIAPNRRLYPGSTPYTIEETQAFKSDSPADVVGAYLKQGEYLLSFVDKMIQQHELKEVIITGWSMGAAFLSAMVCSMSAFPVDAKARLVRHIKGLIWWDLPAQNHGLPDPPSGGWVPLHDEEIPLEQRGQAFVGWVTQYFPHPDLHKRDCTRLIYQNTTQLKPATYRDFSVEQLLSKIDVTAGPRGDDALTGGPAFQPGRILFDRTFLNEEARWEWGNTSFSVLYGEETPWPIVWAGWEIEAITEKAGVPVIVKSMAGANHFPMQDNIDGTYNALLSCV